MRPVWDFGVLNSIYVFCNHGNTCSPYFRLLYRVPDKSEYPDNTFLFLHENKCCGYSLEAPHCVPIIYLYVEIKKKHLVEKKSQRNVCYGYSLQAPQWGASNEYSQYMFLWRKKSLKKYESPQKHEALRMSTQNKSLCGEIRKKRFRRALPGVMLLYANYTELNNHKITLVTLILCGAEKNYRVYIHVQKARALSVCTLA